MVPAYLLISRPRVIGLLGFVVALLSLVVALLAYIHARRVDDRTEELRSRSAAQRVSLAESPEAIVTQNEDAKWAVVNKNGLGIMQVWLEAPDNGTGWWIGNVGPCEVVGVRYTNSMVPKYVHFTDADGRRWRRLSFYPWGVVSGTGNPTPYGPQGVRARRA